MATKSFITDFSINKQNAGKIAKALQRSKPVSIAIEKRVTELKRDQIKAFLGKES